MEIGVNNTIAADLERALASRQTELTPYSKLQDLTRKATGQAEVRKHEKRLICVKQFEMLSFS